MRQRDQIPPSEQFSRHALNANGHPTYSAYAQQTGQDGQKTARPQPHGVATPLASRSLAAPGRLTVDQRRILAEADKVWSRLALALLRSERLEIPWAIGITSAIHEEGRTTGALALASALARETERGIILVSTDASPVAMEGEGSSQRSNAGALSNSLRSAVSYTNISYSAAHRVEAPDAAHSALIDGQAARGRRGFPEMIKLLRQQFSYTIVDLPPLLDGVEAEEMARHLDGTLLLARAGVTPLDKVKTASLLLGEGRLLGVIHLGAPSAIPRWLTQLLGI